MIHIARGIHHTPFSKGDAAFSSPTPQFLLGIAAWGRMLFPKPPFGFCQRGFFHQNPKTKIANGPDSC